MTTFDAEPLIAYYWNEPGSEYVETRLRAIEDGDETGFLSRVTCTEIHYVLRRDDPETADQYLSQLGHWFRVVDTDEVWKTASSFKSKYQCALGDAFVLATAYERDRTAFVGADDCFDDVTEVEIDRFRDDPA